VHGKNIHAQTVNIYEYPKELIELIKKLSLWKQAKGKLKLDSQQKGIIALLMVIFFTKSIMWRITMVLRESPAQDM
jgi:hypothetical protein